MLPAIRLAPLAVGGIALLAALPGPARAGVTAAIVEWGRVTGAERSPSPPEPGDSGLSPAKPLDQRRYLDHSDRIEARLCRHFGITVRFSGGHDDTLPDRIRVRVSHPVFTRQDGATSSEDLFSSAVVDGEAGVGFGFDEIYELQPGAWSIAILVEGRVVAAKAFTVVAPPPGTPLSDCEPETVS